jgi:hypothetical protein
MPTIDIMPVVNAMTLADKAIRVVKHEEDTSEDKQPEAATFIKCDEHRLSRDIELYGFMARVAGVQMMLTCVLEEVVLPLKAQHPEAFRAAVGELSKFDVFGPQQAEWISMLKSMEA